MPPTCKLLPTPLPSNEIEPGFGDVQSLDIDDSASKQLIQQLAVSICLPSGQRDSRLRRDGEFSRSSTSAREGGAPYNLYTFLGHLQRMTTYQQTEVERINSGLTIRRAKKKCYIINDARIRTCISRYRRR